MDLVFWLTGQPNPQLSDPLDRAEQEIKALNRQRRFEEAHSLQEAREHLLYVRRSYENLTEASELRFATLWPQTANGHGPGARLNLVWNGRLVESVSLYPRSFERQIDEALARLWGGHAGNPPKRDPRFVAVAQTELDSLLAIRRWFLETERIAKTLIPEPGDDHSLREAFKRQLTAEAFGILSTAPGPTGARPT